MSDTCPTVRVKHEPSPGGVLIINESDFDAAIHERVDPLPPPAPAPLPPPPGAADPLALPENWKDKDAAELRKLAEVVSGRAVENKKQAIEVIEAALAARG